jgi:phage terminase large subunit
LAWNEVASASLSVLKIPTAKIFEPLLQPARYKGVYGGRGSGKSHFFGELLVETCQAERGTLAVCIREAQRTLAQSSKRLIEGKIASLGLGHGFKIYSDKIETPGDGLVIFRGLQYEAGKYRLMMKARDAVAAKPMPPVQRPGMATTRAEREQSDLRTLNAKLSNSGDIRDAVALYQARKANSR